MDEFVRITLVSRAGESHAEFAARLSLFWTHMLRTRPDDFEKVYAEATEFERSGESVTRQYLVEPLILALLETEMRGAGISFEPIDRDDTFTKYEAVPADWWQIEH